MRRKILLHLSIVIALLFLATWPVPASGLPSTEVVPLVLEKYGWIRDIEPPMVTDVQCLLLVITWLQNHGTMEGFLDTLSAQNACGMNAKLCRIDMNCDLQLDEDDIDLIILKTLILAQGEAVFPSTEGYDLSPSDGVHDACNAAYTDYANPCVLDPDEYPPDQFVGACAQSQKVCFIDGATFGHKCAPVFNPYDDDPANDPEGEICDDGIDNDCDGIVDNPDICQCTPGDTTSCGESDIGGCQLGTTTCGPDFAWGECVGAIDPTEEICENNIDDDCDGLVDEDRTIIIGNEKDSGPGGQDIEMDDWESMRGSGGCSLSTTGAAPNPWAVSAVIMTMGCLLISRRRNRGK